MTILIVSYSYYSLYIKVPSALYNQKCIIITVIQDVELIIVYQFSFLRFKAFATIGFIEHFFFHIYEHNVINIQNEDQC